MFHTLRKCLGLKVFPIQLGDQLITDRRHIDARRALAEEDDAEHFIKTHMPPPQSWHSHERVIFCCRHPIATLESFYRWISAKYPERGWTVKQVLLDQCFPNPHVRNYVWYMQQWLPVITDSDRVLSVRYEDRLEMPNRQLERIARFLNRPLRDSRQPSLEDQIQSAPTKALRDYFAHSAPRRDHWRHVLTQELVDKAYERYRFVFESLGYPPATVLAKRSIRNQAGVR